MAQSLVQSCIGTNGSTVTTSNATGGNQWDASIITGIGATKTWDNGHTLHGNSTALKIHMPTVSSTNYVAWKASITSAVNNAYNRFYLYLSAAPSVAPIRLSVMLTGAGASSCTLLLTTGPNLRLFNAAGTLLATSTNSLPLATWVRVEWECTNISGSTGDLSARFYSGANLEGGTPDTGGTITSSGASIGGQINEVRYGVPTAITETTAFDYFINDVAWNDTVQPGAFAGTPSLSDFGTGNLTPQVISAVVSNQLDDTATDSESITLVTAITVTDTGTDSESVSTSVGVDLVDTGSGSDGISVAVSNMLVDTGSDTESLVVVANTSLADTGTDTENISISVPVPIADTGTDTEVITPLVSPTLIDTSSLTTDSIVVSVTNALADTGSGANNLTAVASALLSDSYSGASVLSVDRPVSLVDIHFGAFNEALSITLSKSLSELFTDAEAITHTKPNKGYINWWNIDHWELKPVMWWDGSDWVVKPIYYWDGTQWTYDGDDGTGLIKHPKLADFGHFTEDFIVSNQHISLLDSGSGDGNLFVNGFAHPHLDDTGSDTETIAINSQTKFLSDSGFSAESITPKANVSLRERGFGNSDLSVSKGAGSGLTVTLKSDLRNYCGINTHFRFQQNYADSRVKGWVVDSGLAYIRERLSVQQAFQKSVCQYLAAHGVKFYFFIGDINYSQAQVDADIGFLLDNPDICAATIAICGPNEANDTGGGANWATKAVNIQQRIQFWIQQPGTNPLSSVLSVGSALKHNVAGGNSQLEDDYQALFDAGVNNFIDCGDFHYYPGDVNGPISIKTDWKRAKIAYPSVPLFNSETGFTWHKVNDGSPRGYHWDPDPNAGRFTPEIYCRNYLTGIVGTMVYEFLDEFNGFGGPYDNTEGGFGLRSLDQHKPAYDSVTQLINTPDEHEAFSGFLDPTDADYICTSEGSGSWTLYLLQNKDNICNLHIPLTQSCDIGTVTVFGDHKEYAINFSDTMRQAQISTP